MTFQDDFVNLFRYLRWADDRLIEACRAVSHDEYTRPPVADWSSLRATVSHLADSGDIWSRRIILGESPASFRKEEDLPTLDDAARLLDEVHGRFDAFVADQPADRLAETFTYKSLMGKTASAPLWSVLRHIVNHATYHRGQAASKLRLVGGQPPGTDLVFWAMEMTR